MKDRWEHLVGLLGLAMVLYGSWLGLFVAPPDKYMGDVQRIMYVHVPTAWAALLCFTFGFVVSIGWLLRGGWRWDALQEASIEVGVLLGVLLLVQGSIWARPTWGVWWDWDPRLTTSAVLVLAFGAILALRTFVDDPRRRATWTAVASVIAFVDVPIVYYSVRWWRSLHQVQSSMETVDKPMATPLAINALAVLLIATWLIARRFRLARKRNLAELAEMEAA
jgi:heme exporter protein C